MTSTIDAVWRQRAAGFACASIACAALAAPLPTPSLNPDENIRRETGEITVNGVQVSVIRYVWRDSAGDPRSVSLVPASGTNSGYAAEMTYQVTDAGKRTVVITSSPGADGGFGYFVSHELFRNFSDATNNTISSKHAEDDSPLGRYLPSTASASSVGVQQAVHEYRLSYPRWGTVAAVADPSVGVISANPADHQRFLLPVIIRWTFIAGQDYPLWSVDYDLSAATDRISSDVRGPYGVMSFNEGVGPEVTALRWGDRYRFAADAGGSDFGAAASPAGALAWSWSAANTGRRYNVLGSGNYELGIVDTVAASVSKYADGYSDARTHNSPTANCGYALLSLPCPYEWSYQSFQYDYGPPARPKLAWGSAPFLGSSLAGAWNGVESVPLQGTGHISYGTHIVFGRSGAGTPLTLAKANAPLEPSRTLNILSTPFAGGTVTYTLLGDTGGPYSQLGQALPPWTSVRLVATPAPGYDFLGWSISCLGVTGPVCMLAMDGDRFVEAIFTQAADGLSLSPISILFDPQSAGTTSAPRIVTITNTGGTPVTIGPVSTDGPFSPTTDCTTLAPAESCSVSVFFTPLGGGLIGATQGANGTLSVARNVGSTRTVALAGNAENSLVRHYYRAILNRTPDTTGLNYWQGEAARLASLSVDVNETWFVMAGYFFNSAEYAAAAKSDAAFVADLYNTFFNRAPDGAGSAYWVGQIQGGLPRDVVLFSFMFSNEFRGFTQAIFGNTASRPEVNIVMDFFRGILNRIPDTASFQYWLGRMRVAQCAGAGPVYTEVDAMSAAFIFNAEYNNRARNNTQFVTDMYYSFLRRGGDAGGVNYWINELNTGSKNINAVRFNFLNSPEFGARVQAVIAAGCYTGP